VATLISVYAFYRVTSVLLLVFFGNISRHTAAKQCTITVDEFNKKSDLMLMRRARVFTSFCSQVILVYLYPFRHNSLFCRQKNNRQKITKNQYF